VAKNNMKKITVVIQNTYDKDFVGSFLKNEGLDFEIFDINQYDNSDFPVFIVDRDLDLLKNNNNFDAQIFQSVDENIPTRLLVPNNFSEKEHWDKEYALSHELGHYFSMENDLIWRYYDFLEKAHLPQKELTQLIRIPFEVEAEKYVFEKKRELFDEHADAVYLDYQNQLRTQIHLIDENSIMNSDNFSAVYEIRLFRYNCIIENTYDRQSEHYAKHKKSIDAVKEVLATRGKLFSDINKKVDPLSNSLRECFYESGDFLEYLNQCKEIYTTVTSR
jgi:hypothetical protein